jgi:hypothetical protein
MWMRSRLALKQKTWARLLDLPALKMTTYFLGPMAPSNGPTFLVTVGERGMRRSMADDKQDVAVPVDVVGERVLVTIGKREVVVHPSSIIGKEEVQRAWCVVAVGG